MRLFIGLMLVSLNLFAANWSELEEKTQYKLTQSFQLPQIERSGALLNLMKGEKFVLTQITGLDMINVSLFVFEYINCPGKSMKTDIEIIPVNNTSPVVEIGAQVTVGCKLEIFIENKDLISNSFFE